MIIAVLSLDYSPAAAYEADGWKARQSRLIQRQAVAQTADGAIEIEVYVEPEHQSWGRLVGEWTSSLYRELYNRYVFSLKDKVLEPFLKNANFRRALKDLGTDQFRTYDRRIREDITFLINNLVDRYGYSEQSAREVCIYVVDNELAEEFEE